MSSSFRLTLVHCRVEEHIKYLVGTAGLKMGEQLMALVRDYAVTERERDGVPKEAYSDDDTRYFPKDKTVERIMGRVIRAQRLHDLDQPATALYLEERKRTNPRDRIHAEWYDPSNGKEVMIVYQTAHQARMLELFGDYIVCCDATYKLVQWGFPFFILSVIDNHGQAQPVAYILLEHETGANIGRALKILRDWNQNWKPANFMVDKDIKEENAIRDVFHDCPPSVLLCDFHRLQAWWRTINKSDFGVPRHRKMPLFKELQEIANLEDVDVFWERVAALKASSDLQNVKLAEYLDRHWWNCAGMWARCYRLAYHGGIDTNNPQEAINSVLKNKWMKARMDRKRMESLMKTLVEKAQPYFERKYRQNTLRDALYLLGSHQVAIPSELMGMTRVMIERHKDRMARGRAAMIITPCEQGWFLVQKSDQTLELMMKECKRSQMVMSTCALDSFKGMLSNGFIHGRDLCYQTHMEKL